LLEEQLSDGRHWLFDTEEPTLADISVHFVAAWVKSWGESAHLNKEKLPYLSKVGALGLASSLNSHCSLVVLADG